MPVAAVFVVCTLIARPAADYRASASSGAVAHAAADAAITANVKGVLRRTPDTDTEGSAFRITAGDITWDVDIIGDSRLLRSAQTHAGSVALVSGTYAESRGRAGLRRALAARSIGAPDDDPRPDFIDVTIRGTLSTGMVAIGGETTGLTIAADAVKWELEVGPRQQNLVSALNGRRVLVSGELTNRRGVELPNRYVVSVRRLERAPEQP